MTAQGLQQKTVSGVLWNFLEIAGNQGITLLVTFILARFLLPNDFGLIAMLSIFFSLASALMEAGFLQALIRKKDTTPIDYSTMFFSNIVLGVIAYFFLFLSAPFLARFYNEPRLILLTRVVGLVVILTSFQLVHLVDLARRLDFKTRFKATLPANLISAVIAIFMAAWGMGVWSLVARMLLVPLLMNITLWKLNNYRPIPAFSRKTFCELWGFGSKILVSRFINVFFDNIYVIVIAKFFPASSVGAFFFAQKIQSTLLHQLTISIQNVTYPALATIQAEDERLKNAYRKIIQLTTYIISPSMVFLVILAPALFSTFLHERWVIAVTYLQVLCISGLMYPLHAINQNLLQVKGRSDLFLYLEIFKKISVIITLFLTLPFGIIPMLWGRVLTSVLNYLPTVYFTNKAAKYSISEQIKDVLPIFLSSFLAGGTLVIFDRFLELPVNSLWGLLIRTALGGALFITTSYLLKLESQRTILHIAKQQLNLKTHLAKED